jgi:Fe-S cluster assembly protein SufD
VSAPAATENMSLAEQLRLPTADEEVWRYSRIAELSLDRFHPAVAQSSLVCEDPAVAIGDTADAALVAAAGSHDVFDVLSARHHHTITVTVPRGHVATSPVVVTHRVVDADVMVFPRLIIDAGENSEVTVVERFESADGVVCLVVPRAFVHAGAAARVSYVGVNQLSRSAWQVAHQFAQGERDSTTLLATVALGGDYARVRTDAKVIGQGATTRQVAVYFADGTQMHDFRTMQDHVAPRTNSDLLFKGAVQDTAKSVYTGLIRIGVDAKGSAAYQTNRNLTLSAGAWAESVPNLDIATNDVKCSHASTVGPIDDDQRYYLESRGIPPDVAERLVVLGFFDEVLSQLPVGDLADELRAVVAAKLDASRASSGKASS